MFKKAIAVTALAVVAFVSVPMAAFAYDENSTITTSDSTPTPGQAVTVSFNAGSFDNLEPVSLSVSGNGDPGIAALAGTATVNKQASATGAVTAAVTIPTNGSGTYTVTAAGGTSGRILNAVLTVVAADSGLAVTGSTFPVLWLWVGGGALALGIALVVVLAVSRRQHNRA